MAQPPASGSMASGMMIKPEQIDALPRISDTDKARYKAGLAQLWAAYNAAPDGPDKKVVENKIKAASTKLMQAISSARSRQGGPGGEDQRPQSQGGLPGQQAGGVPTTGQNAQAQPQQQPQQQQQSQQPQHQQQQQQQQQQRQQQQQGANAAGGGGGQGGNAPVVFSQNVKNYLSKIKVHPRPTINNNADYEAYKKQWYTQAGQLLTRQEQAMQHINKVNAQITQAQQNGGQGVPELEAQKKAMQDRANQAQAAFREMQKGNEENRKLLEQKAQNQQSGQQPPPPPPPNGQQGGNQIATPVQPQQPQVQTQFQQRPQQPPQAQTQNPNAPSQTPQSAAPPQQPPTPVHQTPQSATASQQSQQNFQQFPNQPQQQQQSRPQINPQQAQQNMQQHPSTPGSAVPPQSAGPNQQQRPVQALSQQDAVAQAARSYSQQQSQQVQQAPTQALNQNIPFSQQGQQMPQPQQSQTPASAYASNMQHPPQQMSSSNTKFPIPKTLPPMPQIQTPAPGPPSRPTMQAQSGMLSQPAIQKPPPFTLEGEGDRVLSKRKLDELVRQVTGGSGGEGEDGGLTPEVEEAVLTLADNFVDNVITSACRLAKLRSSQTLDIRDVQIVLERNYGIRIPGYSLDEVRTVRKFQPAAGWQQKMQAVQAGKVMQNANRE